MRSRLKFLLALISLNSGCAHYEPRHALIDQFLVPVAAHRPLLCNRAFEKSSNQFEFKCVDLRNETDRTDLHKMKFVCKIGGQMWAVSKDSPRLVRNAFTKKSRGIFRKDKRVKNSEYLEIEKDYDYLIRSAAKCFSTERYLFSSI